jgi:hypothetical protein
MSTASSDSSGEIKIPEPAPVVPTEEDECCVCKELPANGMVAVIRCGHYLCKSCARQIQACPQCRLCFIASTCVVKSIAEVKVLAARLAEKSACLTSAKAALNEAQATRDTAVEEVKKARVAEDGAHKVFDGEFSTVDKLGDALLEVCDAMTKSDYLFSETTVEWAHSEYVTKYGKFLAARKTLRGMGYKLMDAVDATDKSKEELVAKEVAVALATRAVANARKALLAPPAATASSGRKRRL